MTRLLSLLACARQFAQKPSQWRAWLLWAVVVFGVFNLGPSIDEREDMARELDAQSNGTAVVSYRFFTLAGRERELHPAAPPLLAEVEVGVPYLLRRAAAMQLSDQGDMRRYAAYVSAALGRPYQPYFVRSLAAWEQDIQHRSKRGDRSHSYNPHAAVVVPKAPLVPYRDYSVEYPPGFWAWVLPIGLFNSTPYVFPILFSLWMGVLLSAALWIASKLRVDLYGENVRAKHIYLAAALVLSLGVISTMRFDAVVALLAVIAIYTAVRERAAWSGFAVGVGVATKLVPILIAPALCIYLVATAHRATRTGTMAAFRFITAATLGALLLVLPVWIVSGSSILDMFRYHANRPLEIETIWAAGVSLWDNSVLAPAQREFSFGSMNVVSSHSRQITLFAKLFSVAALLSMSAYSCVQIARCADTTQRARMLVSSSIGILLVFAFLGVVFSPQYLLWVLPMSAALLPPRSRVMAATLWAAFALTQLLFPILFVELADLNVWVHGISLLRTTLLAAYVVLLLRHGFGRAGHEPAFATSPTTP